MSPLPQPPADALSSDPLYPRLKEYLIESTGLAYYADKDADLARRIRHRLLHFNFDDCASYLELLRDPVRGAAETDALINEVTIGETYFFRHREHFDALRNLVVPDLVARNADKRRLHIWCAGCADGAEPYSLSILVRRDLAHLLVGWDVFILGTDINRQFLAAAREGAYPSWSLRSTPEEIRRECFASNGKRWTIAPQYKSGVSFQFHNLVEDFTPPQLDDGAAFDLIICRNVMIYFAPKLMRRVLQRFHQCLAPGGWLLVGPSEPNMTHFTAFHAVNAPGVTLYQKPMQADSVFGQPALFPAAPIPDVAPEVPPPAPIFRMPEPVEYFAVDPITHPAAPTLADLRQTADQGDWENAARYGKQLLESDNLNALVHFNYALVLEQMGEYAESERSLRRAIYLDRQAVLAHYHLALLLRSRGDLRQAERYFKNCLELLEAMPANEALADADGITALELKNLAQTQIECLKVNT